MKPEKPYPEYPLYAHASGKWAKKINGKLHYFGRWDDPTGALQDYRLWVQSQEGLPQQCHSLADALNAFLDAKDDQVERQELTRRSFREYLATAKRFVDIVGKGTPLMVVGPQHFQLFRNARAKTCNLVALGNEVTRIKVMFNWLKEAGHIERLEFGPEFKKPSATAVRKLKATQTVKLFDQETILTLLDEVGVQMRAMMLLGINCGFGPTDCAMLPLTAWKGDWIEFPRVKTGIPRRIPLWPETRDALALASKRRRTPIEELGRFFIMPSGKHWDNSTNPIVKQFSAARERADIAEGGFYWLRHTFATIAGGSKDQIAVNAIMGHVDRHISAVYRNAIDDDRLIAVTGHVRQWLLQGSLTTSSA